MNLFLNELSCKCTDELTNHWGAIGQFIEMIGELKNYGLDKIICPKGYKNMPLGGYCLKDFYHEINGISNDKRIEIVSFMNSSLIEPKEGELNTAVVFSLDSSFNSGTSAHLGNSCTLDLPAVSLTFDVLFKQMMISGYIKHGDKKPVKSTVRNLYHKSNSIPVILSSLKKECTYKNPQKEPMWNQQMVGAYLAAIGHTDDRHSKNVFEKQEYLIRTGTAIALMNGWAHHARLSGKNTTETRKRVIFYSEKFRHADTYLCIDLEHEDIHFELCDYDGCHLKEIKYTGEVTDDRPKSNHNIDV